ncbi:THH1/TOM1/TOM3 domain-containing protein [Entamoeba marina]
MDLEIEKIITLVLAITSLFSISLLISYFIHTVISQYCRRFKKTKQFNVLIQPPFITPRRICHFGIICYIICQINFVIWEFYYYCNLSDTSATHAKVNTVWYEMSNVFDTATFCFMFMLTLIALRIQLGSIIGKIKSLLIITFDVLWVIGVSILLIDFTVHLTSLIYIASLPTELIGSYSMTFLSIRSFAVNIGFGTILLFLMLSFAVMLMIMQRIFKVYNARESKEIKIRTRICGIIVVCCLFARFVLCILRIIGYVKFVTDDDIKRADVEDVGLLSWTDIPLVLLFKLFPSFMIIVMMNKPQLC